MLGINITFITASMESLGESEFVLTIFGAMAQEEIANLSKRVKFGKRINAQKGRVPRQIFGYERIDNFHLQINEREARVVREIYSMYVVEGLGCRRISLRLNQANRATKCNCAWSSQSVRRILTNPIYCGHYVNHRYEVESYLTGKLIQTPPSEHFHHERPEWAIIPVEMFQRAQDQLVLRRKQYERQGTPCAGRYSNRHLFSTLIKCAHCGRSFCRKHYEYKNIRIYWKCTTNDQHSPGDCDNTAKVDEGDLIHALCMYLSSILPDKERFVSRILAEVERRAPVSDGSSIDSGKTRIERRIKELRMKKEKYQEMYAGEVITMPELQNRIGEICSELAELDNELKRCERPAEREENLEEKRAQYRAEIDRFLRLDNATNMDLRKFVEKIVVNKEGMVQIVFRKCDE